MIYITQGGERSGPFPETDVRERFSTGKIAALDMVWSEGMEQWITMKDFAAKQGWSDPSTPPPPPSASTYKEYVNLNCRECGYTGKMGVTGQKKPWWLSEWVLLAAFALCYIIAGPMSLGFLVVFGLGLAYLRQTYTKKLVDCPNCGKSLKQL